LATLGYHYLPSRPPAKISKEEIKALRFLKNQEKGIVFTIPFDQKKAQEAVSHPPRPLYFYESTAYVSAYSQKPVFLEDEVNLTIMGYDWQERREKSVEFLATPDPKGAYEFLKNNSIEYIYWVKKLLGPVESTRGIMEMIFDNEEVQIFKVI
jgi:hypothetical protein